MTDLVQNHPKLEVVKLSRYVINKYDEDSDISGPQIGDQGLASLLKLRHLRVLHLRDAGVTGEGLYFEDEDCIAAEGSIEELKVPKSLGLKDAGLKTILKKCSKGLKCLDLSSTSITGTSVQLPAELKSLKLRRCYNLSDPGLNNLLQKCSNSLIS